MDAARTRAGWVQDGRTADRAVGNLQPIGMHQRRRPGNSNQVPKQSKRLLTFVVDDEPVIATTMELILLSEGFAVRSFVDSLDALRAAESEIPDLLIADVITPTMSGIDLAIQVMKLYPECKVLLFSGHIATGDLLQKARADGYNFNVLVKPVHPSELLAKIKDLIAD